MGMVSVLLSSTLLSQSLAEIARKERERRATLQGKKAVVVTNAELAKVKRKPAVEVPAPPPAAAVEKPAAAAPGGGAGPNSPEPPASTGSPPPAVSFPPDLQDLQAKWDKAKEYVELLTLKMGALWQEFNGLRDPNAKEAVRQTISETYVKLQTAQEDETRARREFEKALGESKKEAGPSLWIK
ncbi:MAG: hypothetical protein A2W03_11550 [Candidatus Aminicenantes bacterium RBG_16_63_16]|nr:MAG: hypothetical protein A2W03_11550 [Candidatus Aminicenantes bacterium RBG_16_63_16]